MLTNMKSVDPQNKYVGIFYIIILFCISCQYTKKDGVIGESLHRWRKEKGDQYPPASPPTPPQAFGKQKAMAH